MRIAHKRKIQSKLHKRIKAKVVATQAKPAVAEPAKVVAKPVEKKAVAEKVVKETAKDVSLTPKQQTVFDIVRDNTDGINPKGIGLIAGQEDSKAASWATGALKKLVEEGLVERVQLAGNKVIYKAA
ncbi:hypothetical protein MHO82_09390 [Vibrio sp. Of7-15]|uniref:hypothetical protein n=1 Tax=Vibrio sp. Of7-15 TaxID=2724879 RepID=UPI001EF19D5C|nr:hypothetical protein [Vibrio sp. Of7-15]MCG7497079.1 hypothetical protein [Vibrio sp. Of7-15]